MRNAGEGRVMAAHDACSIVHVLLSNYMRLGVT